MMRRKTSCWLSAGVNALKSCSPGRSAAHAWSVARSTGRGHQSDRLASSADRATRFRTRYRYERAVAEKRALKPVGRILGGEHRDVGRQRRVERLGRPVGGRPPVTTTLATCPVACTPVSVRPATASPSQPCGIDDVERLADDALDGALARLARPAVEAAAVVLECQLQRRHGRWFYHALTRAAPARPRATSPSTAATITAAPGSIGSRERALQISPSTLTWPPGPGPRIEARQCDARAADERLGPDRCGLQPPAASRPPDEPPGLGDVDDRSRRPRARCSTARRGTGPRR